MPPVWLAVTWTRPLPFTLNTLLEILAGPLTLYVTASPELARALSGKLAPLLSVGNG